MYNITLNFGILALALANSRQYIRPNENNALGQNLHTEPT